MGCTSSSGAKVTPADQERKRSRQSDPASASRQRRTGRSGKEPTKDNGWVPGDESSHESFSDFQDVPPSYPPPEPPPYNKNVYIHGVDFTIVDKRAAKAPKNLQNDYTRLIDYLTEEAEGDLAKVRAILVWVVTSYMKRVRDNAGDGESTENYSIGGQSRKSLPGSRDVEFNGTVKNGIINSQKNVQTSGGPDNVENVDERTPAGDLDRVAEGHMDIAILFALCCRKAAIKCVVIRGQWKPDEYEVGEAIKDACLWNSVCLNGVWRLVHPLWSIRRVAMTASRDQDQITIETSKPVSAFDDYYFLTDPEELITRCLPDDPKWQLLKKPVPDERFKVMPRFTELFFRLGLRLLQGKDGILATTNGRANVTIEFPFGRQPQLYYHISEIELESGEDSGSYVLMDADLLRKCVYMFKKEDRYVFNLKFKKKGLYNLKVYGSQVKSVSTHVERVPLLCQLQIECDQPDRVWRPLPDSPSIGWGQSGLAAKLGVVPVSHKGGIAYSNEHRRVNFMFKVASGVELKAMLFSVNSHDALDDIACEYRGNKVILLVILQARLSEACLRVDARSSHTESFTNVCNFIVRPQQQPLEKERARDRRLKNKLQQAMRSGSESVLVRAMDEYAMFIHTDTGELEKAEERLAFFRLRGNLFDAVQREFVPYLEMAIYDAETSIFNDDLKSYIRVAKAHLQNLKRTATYRNHVLDLNQSLLLEIRSYMKPKSVIYDVMMAALLLLGENRQELYEWKYVMGALSRTGRESILRRMENFDPARVDADRVREAERLWSHYSLEQVWEASAGAAVIYKWLEEAAEKVKTAGSQDDVIHQRSQLEATTNPSQDTVTIPPQRFLSVESIEISKAQVSRKRKASGSLQSDSDDEVATAGQISTELVDSPHGSRTGSRNRSFGGVALSECQLDGGGISEGGSRRESQNSGYIGSRDRINSDLTFGDTRNRTQSPAGPQVMSRNEDLSETANENNYAPS